MRRILLLAATFLFLYSGYINAACISEGCYKGSLKIAFTDIKADMKSGKFGNTNALASTLVSQSRPAYGFASGISKDKGSFILGALFTDLSVSVEADYMEGIKTTTNALVNSFKCLQAPAALVESTTKVQEAVLSGAGKKEMEMILPVVEPFIYDYIRNEGKDVYMKFGFWVENARLALLQGDTDIVVNFLKSGWASGALYFAEALKKDDLPQGVMSALEIISTLSAKEDIGSRDVSSATRAVKTIFELMV
jgi:hypothetical protein